MPVPFAEPDEPLPANVVTTGVIAIVVAIVMVGVIFSFSVAVLLL